MSEAEMVPMSEAEIAEWLSRNPQTKREEIESAYKRGNTKIIGKLVPGLKKGTTEYQRNIHGVELALQAIFPGTIAKIIET